MASECEEWLDALVRLPGPAGQEEAVRDWMAGAFRGLGYEPRTDAKGNLIAETGAPGPGPSVLVTAHMDEIALMVVRIEPDGAIRAAPLGGVYTWKWGEGPVSILTDSGPLEAIVSFGCIHTNAEESTAEWARTNALNWERAFLFTGQTADELEKAGVRPGLRVVISASRRGVTRMGNHLAGYFLDDRADLAAMLAAMKEIRERPVPGMHIVWAATASEEVGGDGAQFLLHGAPCEVCVALEIGPRTPEADFEIDESPTIWVRDGYAAMEARDGKLLSDVCDSLGMRPHWQYLSRGGSDASCAASRGLTARPVTLGFPVENSHGFEVMRKGAMENLARLLVAYLRALQAA